MKCQRFSLLSVMMTCIVVMVCFTFSVVAQDKKTLPSNSEGIQSLVEQDYVKKKYPKLQDRPFGKGIFAHVRRTGNTKPVTKDQIDMWVKNPYIAGTQLSYSWVELEPKEGEYRWDIIERDMEPWAQEGKKCWIEVMTANKRDKIGKRGTPDWVFEKGVPKVQVKDTARYPVFWDQKYIELWGNFIRAFAKKFDGDPRIEFVSIGGYSNGTEPNLSAWDNKRLMGQWRRFGFDDFTVTGIYLNKAIKPILKIKGDAFRKTPVAQAIHVKTDFDWALNKFAASKKFILLSNVLNVKVGVKTRQMWRNLREELDTKVGYAEWGGAAGRETNPTNIKLKKERKQALKEGRKPENIHKSSDQSTMAKLMDVYRAAIGDDSDQKLRPYSRISYLPLGKHIPAVETEKEWQAALKWAWEHLDE